MEQKLNQKLAIIQTELKAKKSRFNSFGKYNFRSAEDILEAIKPFLVKYDVSVRLKEKLVGNNIIKSTAIISDGLENIKATSLVGVDTEQKGMQMPQRFGSASSYGKKYSLGNLFLIDDTKDADSYKPEAKVQYITAKQEAQIVDLINETDADLQAFLKWLGIGNVHLMDKADYSKAFNALNAKLRNK